MPEPAPTEEEAADDATILCDYCLRPIEPEEAVTEGKRDWHPDCPKRRITEEEADGLLTEVLIQQTETKAFMATTDAVHQAPEFATYPAPNAADPFVFVDIILDDGEASIALGADETEALGKSLLRAADAAREDDDV